MKRLIALALACAVVPLASADLYKYVDKDGKTVYSDQPPPGGADAKTVHVAPGPSTPAKSFVQEDKALDKARKEDAEKAKKADQEAAREKLMAQRCEQAQANYRAYAEGGRLLKYDEKGERQYMTDEEIEAARMKSKQQMDEACRKS